MSNLQDVISRLERVIQTGVTDKDGMHPISAERVLEELKSVSIDVKAEEVLSKIYDAVNGINALVDRASGEWIPLNTELIASKYDVIGYHRGGFEPDTFMVVRKGAVDDETANN